MNEEIKPNKIAARPRLFLSYSWTSPSHQDWVLSLATNLRENGVDVILDKWDLKEGQDAHVFMEKMVTDPDIKKVALICDRLYAEKADGRSGGVGTEAQIISPEIYASQNQTKFVAILPELDEVGKPFLPAYIKSRIYIDLSSPDLYSSNFEQLIRWIYDRPLYVKPELGKTPAFLEEDYAVSLPTAAKFRLAITAIRENKPYLRGALRDYFGVFSDNLERFRIQSNDIEFDDLVVRSIEEFIPYRNEALEIINMLAIYLPTEETWEVLHFFFEKLIPYIYRPEHIKSFREWDFDNFKFIIHELFLYAIATLIRHECFPGVAHMIRQYYYVPENAMRGREEMAPFSELQNTLKSLDYRNKRLKCGRHSLLADFLEKRAKASGLTFQQIMQADFVLYIRSCVDMLRAGNVEYWWPITLVYAGRQYGPFEIFTRSQSAKYFDKLKQIFDIADKESLALLRGAFETQKLIIPRWEFDSFDPFELMGFEKIATLP